jgi:hypothetical protein
MSSTLRHTAWARVPCLKLATNSGHFPKQHQPTLTATTFSVWAPTGVVISKDEVSQTTKPWLTQKYWKLVNTEEKLRPSVSACNKPHKPQDLSFLWNCYWRSKSPGTWRCVAGYRIHRNAGPHNLEGLNIQRLWDPLNLRTLSKVEVKVTG